MKKRILHSLNFAFVMAVLFTVHHANATTKTWVGAGTGGNITKANFNLASNWSPSGAPVAGDDLTINFDGTATVLNPIVMTATTTIHSLTITGLYGLGNLNTSGFNLTVTGALQMLDTRSNIGGQFSLIVGTGSTLTCNSFSDLGIGIGIFGANSFLNVQVGAVMNCATTFDLITSGAANAATAVIIGGTLTVGGTTTINSTCTGLGGYTYMTIQATTAVATATFNGAVNIGASSNTLAPNLTSTGGGLSPMPIINFNNNVTVGPTGSYTPNFETTYFGGSAAQTLTVTNTAAASVYFNNLVIAGQLVTLATSGSAAMVNGNLTVNTGAMLDLGIYQLDRTLAGGTLAINGTGKLLLAGASNFPVNFNTTTLSSTSTVEYNGTVAQTIVAKSYGNLTLTNGGTSAKKTPAGVFTMTGNLLINQTAALDVGIMQLTGTVGKTFTNNGYLYVGSTNNFPAVFGTNIMSTASTVEYNGTVAQIISTQSYGNLTMANGGSAYKKTLAGAFTMTGNLLINSTVVLDVAAFQLTGTAGTTFTNNGYVYVAGTSNFPASFGTYTLAATSTVEYNATTVAQTAAAIATPGYGNLIFTGGGSSFAKAYAGSMFLQGDLTVNGTVRLNAGTNSIARTTSGGTFTIGNGGVYTTTATTAATDFPVNFATFNANTTGDYRYIAAGAQPIKATAYGQLTIQGGTADAPKTFLGNATTVTGATINSASFVDLGTSTLNNTGSNGVLINNGYFKIGGAFPVNYTFQSGTSSTVELNGAIAQALSGQTYNNLIFNNTNGSIVPTDVYTVNGLATFTKGIVWNRNLGVAKPMIFTAGATVSSANNSSFVNGYVRETAPTAGFVMPIGQTTYMPITFTAASTGYVAAAWYDASTPSPAIIGGIKYTFQPGYYDFSTFGAAGSMTVSIPASTPAGAHLIGTANGTTYTDLGVATSVITVPTGAYKVYFASQPPIYISAVVLLQGSYTSGTTMYNALETGSVLPLTQPYASGQGTAAYSGTEHVAAMPGTAVDWVLVQLRSTLNGTAMASRAGILLQNGTIVDTTAGFTSPLTFPSTASGSYYIVVRHRNSLAVMSGTAQPLSGGTLSSYDFSSSQSQAYQNPSISSNLAMVQEGTRYALWGGDVNSDGVITLTGTGNDFDALLSSMGGDFYNYISPGYLNGDVNMDDVTTATGTGNDFDWILANVLAGDFYGYYQTNVP